MKQLRFLALGICLTVFSSLSAQTGQGSWMIGGTGSVGSQSTGDNDEFIIDLSPLAGYFVIDNLGIGLQAGFVSTSADETNSTSYSVGPFVRYYFAETGMAKFFGHVEAGFMGTNFDNGVVEGSATGFNYAVGVGVGLFLNEHVSIDGIIGYSSFKFEEAEDPTTFIGLSLGVSAFLSGGE